MKRKNVLGKAIAKTESIFEALKNKKAKNPRSLFFFKRSFENNRLVFETTLDLHPLQRAEQNPKTPSILKSDKE